MKDKELLELAAKAAGITYKYYSYPEGLIINDDQWPLVTWNPLTDDGDALRLAVKLQIDITNLSSACYCEGPKGQDGFVEVENNNPYAATRRAIVKAAAKIKRN